VEESGSGALPGVLKGPATRIRGRASAAAILKDCDLVLLTATREEAAPLLAGLADARSYELATKTVVVGKLRAGSGGPRNGLSEGRSESSCAAVAVTGCDKTNTAHALTCLLETMADALPSVVMQVGIAGGFETEDGSGPIPGDVVLATEEVFADAGSSSPDGWLSADDLGLSDDSSGGCRSMVRFPLDRELVRRAEAVLVSQDDFCGADGRSKVLSGRCLTSSRVTGMAEEAATLYGRWGALAESMEGAAAAQICSLYEVPFLELRGISNRITDRDRSSWRVGEAIAVSGRAALTICTSIQDILVG